MKIKEGDIFWIHDRKEIKHPFVIIQVDGDEKVRVCRITTNSKKLDMPGNILLDKFESGLEKESIVDVSDVSWKDIKLLEGHIGTLSKERIKQTLAGVSFVEKLIPKR